LFSGILNATGRFAAAAAAPILLNVFVIAAMTLAYTLGQSVITWLIWTVPFAGIAQLALTWTAATRAGFALRPGLPRFTQDMRQLLKVAIPAALATGVMQINLVVGQLVASRFEGAVSWLFAADRLYQLPLGIVGIAVGIVLLPDLSRKLEADDQQGAKSALSRAAEFAMLLTIPSAVALCIIALPLVSVLFGRGETGPDDVAAIAVATIIYGLGLPAFVLQKVQQPLFFARSDTRTPFRMACVTMVLNAALAFGLAPSLTWMAPAVATTVSGWAMVFLLWWASRGMGDIARFDTRLRKRLPRIIVASAVMGAVLWGATLVLGPALSTDYLRYPALATLIAIGLISFFASAGAFGAMSLSDLKSSLRRSR
jgi:putative peptidoglycan lipid II flippase